MAELQNMEFPLQIKRQYAGPLDTTEIFESLTTAQEYATSGATKYVGQIIQVVEDGTAKAYIIQKGGTLTEVGSATAGDGKSIALVDGKLQILGFDGVAEAGLQLITEKIPDSEPAQFRVKWQKPDSTTIEGLTQRVLTLENTIVNKVDKTKVATTEELGLLKSGSADNVGEVVVSAGGVASVSKVASATSADSATNATNLNGHPDTYFAKESDMATAKSDITELQTDVSGLKGGTVKSKTAELADAATKLATARNISISGDGTATPIAFDGTADVVLALALSEVATAGTGCKVTVDAKGRVTEVQQLSASDIPALTADKITDLGTAATKNVGTAVGNVVVVAADGKIDASLMPAIAITSVNTVANKSAMLALEDVQVGDIAIVTDEAKSYILTGSDPSQEDSWTWLKTPDCKVLSVNGKTGAITLSTDDVAEGSTNLYFTAGRFTTEFAKHASTELTDTDTLLRTSDTLILDGGTLS